MNDARQRRGILARLERSIGDPGSSNMQEWLDRALDIRIPADDLRFALVRGMERVRHRLMSSNFGLPEFLVSIDSVLDGLSLISDQDNTAVSPDLSLVIGVVKGDPHDLGKNVIAAVYKAYGYRVIDLGRDVSSLVFVESVIEHKARILALSAMMSTTMTGMKDIIREVRSVCPATKIIVGGAPLSEVLARSYGADSYVESALTVIEKTRAMLGMDPGYSA